MPALFLLLLALTATDPPRPGPWPPRTYACPRVSGGIEIDGRLDEAAWDRAAWTSDFVDIEGDRRPAPRYRTRAKMVYDDRYFYVAAEMVEPAIWATLRERDSVIYHDNDFELFLDPDGDSHLYTELELNAFNTVWDLLLVKPYRDGGPAIHAYDIPGLLTAVGLEGSVNDPADEDRGWSVEIAVPFAALAETTTASCPPAEGDRWRVNFSRVQWHLEVESGGYRKSVDPASGQTRPEDNWVWSPQREIAMHEPEHWGIVEFGAAKAPAPATENVVEWHLRFHGYALAQAKSQTGTWPAELPQWLPAGGPELPAGFEGPAYWTDGERYTLRGSTADRTYSLDEQGRFLRQARD